MNMSQIKRQPSRKITKCSITKEQILTLLSRAAQPIKKQQSDGALLETSETGRSDGCVETHTQSDRIASI